MSHADHLVLHEVQHLTVQFINSERQRTEEAPTKRLRKAYQHRPDFAMHYGELVVVSEGTRVPGRPHRYGEAVCK